MTVLDTNEKPTRPPPRKFKFSTKPRVASSQIKPTTTTSAASVTTTRMMVRTSTTVKPKWESPVNKTRKKNKLKPWGKNKVQKKQETNAQAKKIALKSKTQLKKASGIKPVNSKTKLKAKTNQTASADLKTDVLKISNSLKDNTVHTKKKVSPQKSARKQMSLQKSSLKVKNPRPEGAFLNITKTNLKTKGTTLNKLQLQNKQARDAKIH